MADAPPRAGSNEARALTGVNYLLLSFALMGGAVAWLARLIVASALTSYACQAGATWTLWATTLVTAAVAGASLMAALRFHARAQKDSDASSHLSAAGWLGLLGAMMNVAALTGIIFESASFVLLDVCARAA